MRLGMGVGGNARPIGLIGRPVDEAGVMLWDEDRPFGGRQPPGRNQREQSRQMNRSAEDGAWSSPHYGDEGAWVPLRRTKVCADDTVGKSVSDSGRPGIVRRQGMAGIVRHSQTKGRATGNAK